MREQKKLVYITRRMDFNAAHRLHRADWTEEQNEAMFGKCANRNWHGHNFELYVTVKGTPDPLTGFIMDLKKIKSLVQREVIDHLDHKNLNMDVPFLQGIMPSIENLAMAIWDILKDKLDEGCQLHSIRIRETRNNFVEYFGE